MAIASHIYSTLLDELLKQINNLLLHISPPSGILILHVELED